MGEQPPRRRSRWEVMDAAQEAGRRHARLNPPPDKPWRSLTRLERLEILGVGLALVLILTVPLCERAT